MERQKTAAEEEKKKEGDFLTIDRYLVVEICKPLAVIGSILAAVFTSYTATEYLADAAGGLLLGRAVVALVFFKLVVGLEFLLPISLYLSVVVALGRLYADAEITALHACGVGVGRVLKVVLSVSLVVAAVTASVSLHLRPWAYDKFYELRSQAMTEFDVGRLEAGNFLEISQERSVIFAEAVDHKEKRAEGVFIQKDRGDSLQVILAKECYQQEERLKGEPVLEFVDGYLYEFSRHGDGDSVLKFERSTLSIPRMEAQPARYKRRAASTARLLESGLPKDVAEFQWRLSAPLTTILLALLAVPLSRTAPRQGRYAKVAAAVIVYVLYYNLCAVSKSWVEQGVVGAIPGIWWVQVCLGVFVFFVLWQQDMVFQGRNR
jgi:lipopolysaccharide export system permease protein